MTNRTAARLAWSAWALSLALGVLSFPLQAVAGFEPADVAVFVPIFAVLVLGFSTIGLLIASRQPGNAIGWIFLAVGVSWAASGLADGYAYYALATGRTSSTLARIADWSGQWNWMPLTFLAPILIALLFPNGRPLSRRWRFAVWMAVGSTAFFTLTSAIAPGPLEDPAFLKENPFALRVPGSAIADAVGALGMFAAFGASIVSLVLRLRRSRGEERQQMKWLAFALVLTVAIVAAGFLIGGIFGGVESTTLAGIILIALILAALAFVPVAAGIAILKYRLYDIDVVIKKTLVFGILVVLLMVVGGVGALVLGLLVVTDLYDTPPLLVLAGAVYGLIAIPLYRLSKLIADQLVYGRRATPYEVLTEFGERVGETYSTEDVLPRMAQILAGSTGASIARVWLRVGDEIRVAAVSPADAPHTKPLPLVADALAEIHGEAAIEVRHQGELLGALTVAMPANDPMNPAKERLVRDLASQAGLVLRNVRLIEELRASRQRLVVAQDEERRRIERNLHDGAQQQLIALAVQLKLARQTLDRDPATAGEMLDTLQGSANEALEDLRNLARGIYPPLLADKGLAAALESQARKSPVPVEVSTNGIDRYPQDVEAAVYFCALEALQNVAKYANATRATVRLAAGDEGLRFEVSDDGVGFDPNAPGVGTGLRGMADRVEALGGALDVRSAPGQGTTVSGHLPVPEQGRGP